MTVRVRARARVRDFVQLPVNQERGHEKAAETEEEAVHGFVEISCCSTWLLQRFCNSFQNYWRFPPPHHHPRFCIGTALSK